MMCETNACLFDSTAVQRITEVTKSTLKFCLNIPIKAHLSGDVDWLPARNYSRMWGMTLNEGVRYLLGTQLPADSVSTVSN